MGEVEGGVVGEVEGGVEGVEGGVDLGVEGGVDGIEVDPPLRAEPIKGAALIIEGSGEGRSLTSPASLRPSRTTLPWTIVSSSEQ